MYKKVTSTELKQNTRKVLRQVVNEPDRPVLVFNYNEPLAWIIKFDPTEPVPMRVKNRRMSIEELSRFFVSSDEVIDSAKEIRKMRDEE